MISFFWMILLAILLLIEIVTLGFKTVWFAGGALTAFVVSLVFHNILLEIILFLAVSVSLLIFTRPLVMQYFQPKGKP